MMMRRLVLLVALLAFAAPDSPAQAAIAKLFAVAAHNTASGGALTTGTFDSTGYTHLVVFAKHEGTGVTLTPSDNKSSTSWNSLTQENHTNGDVNGQMFWVAIGTPGTGHTVTVTPSANRSFRGVIVWLVDADSGTAALDAQSNAEGSNNAPDAGSLGTTGASVVSFLGAGLYNNQATTPGAGWTEDVDGSGITHSGFSRGPETTTPIDPVSGWGISDAWVACAASLREVAGGGGSTQPPRSMHQFRQRRIAANDDDFYPPRRVGGWR